MHVFERGGELLHLPRHESVFWFDPYVPRDGITVLYGRPTIGKTAVAWQMAQAIQTGSTLWRLPTTRANVLFLELDMPMVLAQERWIDAEPPFSPEFSIIFEGASIDSFQLVSRVRDERHKEIAATLTALHEKLHYGVVFVDALREVVVGDINVSGIPRRVYDAFRTVFPGAAIVFIHHERKTFVSGFGPGDPLQAAAGSMEFMNHATVSLQFHRRGRETFLFHLKSQASAQFEPLPISLAPDGVHVYNRQQERLLLVNKMIQDAPQGLSRREVDKYIGEKLGLSDRSVRLIRKGLLQEGRIRG